VFFNIVTRRYLFNGKDVKALILKNKNCDLSDADRYLEKIPLQEKALVQWLLQPDPALRPSARQALSHAWFRDNKDTIDELLKLNIRSTQRLPMH
jgi:serine/threonine protein kinase